MPLKEDPPTSTTIDSGDIALRLLQFQQRLEALDHLYNEEIGGLKTELKQLKVDFVQQQTSAPPRRTRRARRDSVSRRPAREEPTQQAQEAPDKEGQ